jgi:hypothetical protein
LRQKAKLVYTGARRIGMGNIETCLLGWVFTQDIKTFRLVGILMIKRNKMEIKKPELEELDCPECEIESTSRYDGTKKRLMLTKTIIIPKNLVLYSAPKVIEHVQQHYETVIPIGNNHVARLIISESAALALAAIEPKTTII